MLTASASDGGGTFTAWKRRSSERSFSIDLRNSAGVVAPMHWISPRDNAGFKMFAASSEPSAEPAPTSVCNSSMKMMEFCDCLLYTSDAADERSSVDLGGR